MHADLKLTCEAINLLSLIVNQVRWGPFYSKDSTHSFCNLWNRALLDNIRKNASLRHFYTGFIFHSRKLQSLLIQSLDSPHPPTWLGGCAWLLRCDSPEVPLFVGDSVSWAVRCWRLQNNYLHLLRSVATGTGHQALPDASDAHVDVGQDDLTGGGEQRRKAVRVSVWHI